MLILILRAKNSMQGEGEKRSRDARYYFTPGLDLFGNRSNCTPKSLKNIEAMMESRPCHHRLR